MNFECFKNDVIDNIKSYLPASYIEAEISINPVVKNNNVILNGLLIRGKNESVTPTIYLESFYDDFESGTDMEHILEKIARIRLENEVSDSFDFDEYINPDKVRNNVVLKLINSDKNKDLLAKSPHFDINGNLSVIYLYKIGAKDDSIMTTTISSELLNRIDISEEELLQNAFDNTKNSTEIRPMYDIISDMIDDFIEEIPEEKNIWVLSNQTKMFGAANILDAVAMDEFVKKHGPVYCLPSSIHEWILIKADDSVDVDSLADMISEVNRTQVNESEVLDERPWYYSMDTGLVRH